MALGGVWEQFGAFFDIFVLWCLFSRIRRLWSCVCPGGSAQESTL